MNIQLSTILQSPIPMGGPQEKAKSLTFSSSLRRCEILLTASGQKPAAEQIEMIRSSAMSFANLKERKRYYLSLNEEMIDILQAVPPQKLAELQSEKFEVHFQRLLELSLISSRILHDEPERVYPEHKIFFAALFWQLSKMKQIKRAIEFENTFQENSWKQRAAVDGIVAALPPEDIEKLD